MAKRSAEDHNSGMQARRKAPHKRHSERTVSEVEKLRGELRAEKLAREAAERRCRELEYKCERLEAKVQNLTEQVEELLSARWRSEEYLQKEIRKLNREITERDEKLERANKQIAWFQKNHFGRKSEKEKQEDKLEAKAQQGVRGQRLFASGHGRSDRSEIETEVKYLEVPNCICDQCKEPYLLLDKTEASPLIEQKVLIVRTIYQRRMYVSQCRCKGKRIVVAAPPPKLYPRTEIGNSLWVKLVTQKFLHGVPTNRILKELSLYGLSLSAGTVTGGCKIINDLLKPIYAEITDHCRGAEFWNADETTWRVFDAKQQKWWFWLFASGDCVVHLLDPSRSSKIPTEFFAGSSGILMSDRLASYKGLQENIRKAWCWVHVRRDFLNLYTGVPKLKRWAKRWLHDIADLFVLNHKRFELWDAGKDSGLVWEQSLEQLNQHIDKMQKRLQQELRLGKQLHKEQRKVLKSLKRHWDGLTIFLEDPRIPLHNNRAERLLRNSVILRKNSFGSGTAWSGHMAASIFSAFQTWLINELDPQALLLDYFNECSKTPGKPPPDVSQFLPWKMSEERKRRFALPDSYERPG